jgi:hypothetical protein
VPNLTPHKKAIIESRLGDGATIIRYIPTYLAAKLNVRVNKNKMMQDILP